MRKRLPPDFLLNFNIDTIINKLQNQLLNKVFGVVEDALGLNDDTKKSGVPGITLSNKDVEIFTTRNLQVFAMNKEDLNKGDFDKAVFVSNEVPIEEDAEPVIVRFVPRPLLADYELGTIDRYVLFDIRNSEIIEVSQDDYVKFRTLRYKRSFVISWYIFGKADDYRINNYIYPGVRNNNIDVLAQAEATIPGITDYFVDKTEFLLESLDDYSGDPEIVNLPEPEEPLVEIEEEIEDIGFGSDTVELPELPKIDLDFADDLAGDFTAADELLGNVSSSIEDLLAMQDQVTAEQESLLAENEKRLREIEEEQEKQNRKSAFNLIVNDLTTDEGKWAQNIVEMSSGAKNKKKRRRLDQGRDEEKAALLFRSLFSDKHKNDKGEPYNFTPEELVEWGNDSKLNTRMRLRLTSKEFYTEWTRDNKKFYGKTVLKKLTDSSRPKSTEIPDPTINYDAIQITPSERRAALALLRGRESRKADLRAIIQKLWKEQKVVYNDKVGRYPDKTSDIRNQVQDRYNQWRRQSSANQTGRYSKRGRAANRQQRRTDNRASRNRLRRQRGR
tara:strand:- start:2395 stop:4068 length:1674 start_codon:yes stop_codon:yes gene_type:complete